MRALLEPGNNSTKSSRILDSPRKLPKQPKIAKEQKEKINVEKAIKKVDSFNILAE